ncbi:hypothetical protein KFL_004070110 [Klebsormidium nitens]|uniref:Uncharacterized protein n=1 Tax=Klebsormidium nitens TaxID=105231 RepID=A0A1Y1IFE4_KLENI|nr:hypothetical protein KFL_004070110 [Klebsormidium nitens]|eukprot:GAQ88189.1 hypothetical protein KFL_004070110 [Klebsormidium nitens]
MGKTATCQLIYGRARKRQEYDNAFVLYINCARKRRNESLADFVFRVTGMSLEDLLTSPEPSPTKSANPLVIRRKMLIFDEAHVIYASDLEFWDNLKGLLPSNGHSVDIVVAASRGSTAQSAVASPITIGADNRVAMRRTLPTDIALQFTELEFLELFEQYERLLGFEKGSLGELKEMVAEAAELLPGITMLIMDHLRVRLSPSSCSDAAEWQEKTLFYLSRPTFVESLADGRTFPRSDDYTPIMWDLLDELLSGSGPVSFAGLQSRRPALTEVARALVRKGYLHENVVLGKIEFPSGLHREVYTTYYFRARYAAAQHMPQDIEVFLRQVVSRMSRSSLERSLNTSKTGDIHEAQFDVELYRAAHTLLPSEASISPGVGIRYGLKAYVDKVVMPQGWAFEALVDGRGLAEHEARFQPGGRYWPLINDGVLKAWIVVDFRNVGGPAVRDRLVHSTYHVSFCEHFVSAEVRSRGQVLYTVNLAE